MEFTEKDLQVIIAGLLKLPAEHSFDLLMRLKQYMEASKPEEPKEE